MEERVKPPCPGPLKRGMTLVEILFAMALLTAIVIGGLRLMGSTGFGTARSGSQAQATRVLQGLAEECRAVPLSDLEACYAKIPHGGDAWLDPRFMPLTKTRLQEWQTKAHGLVKEFQASASVRILRDPQGKLAEIWFYPEITWLEIGQGKEAAMRRTVRAGFMRANPQATREVR